MSWLISCFTFLAAYLNVLIGGALFPKIMVNESHSLGGKHALCFENRFGYIIMNIHLRRAPCIPDECPPQGSQIQYQMLLRCSFRQHPKTTSKHQPDLATSRQFSPPLVTRDMIRHGGQPLNYPPPSWTIHHKVQHAMDATPLPTIRSPDGATHPSFSMPSFTSLKTRTLQLQDWTHFLLIHSPIWMRVIIHPG